MSLNRLRVWLIQFIAGRSIKIIVNMDFYSTVTLMGGNHYFIRTNHWNCNPAIEVLPDPPAASE